MAEWEKNTNSSTAGHDETFVVEDNETGNTSVLSNSARTPAHRNEYIILDEATTAPTTVQGDQVRGNIATRACLSCRRLKMKCLGAAEPPCERCVKAGRKCEFLQPGQTLPAQPRRPRKPQPEQSPGANDPERDVRVRDQSQEVVVNRHRIDNHASRLSHGPMSNSYNTPSWTTITPEPPTQGAAKKTSELTYVYSASPLTTAVDSSSPALGSNNASSIQQPTFKRRRTGGNVSDTGETSQKEISERDMQQLLELFQERLLGFIQILGPEDFDDVPTMLRERKSLVQCICYVTARFVPGGSAIRDQLYSSMLELLLNSSDTQRSTPTQSLALLQALIVLYAYAQAVPTKVEGSQSPPKDLLYWRIKALTEAHAIQLFLHRSIEGLRAAVASRAPQVQTSYCYKMYTYWLWLYTMSHHGSLATRTPPSIRADASIRAASKLLNEIGMNAQISHLLGEVELCLSWEQASIQGTELGEWWCQPESGKQKDITNKDSLDEIQAAIYRWTHKWNALIATDQQSNCSGFGLNLHLRFTQFCITTYSIRPRKIPELGTEGLLPSQKEAIVKCTESASNLLSWALDLGPVSKDRLRYLGDFGFVMFSFCAFFILRSSQAFGSAIPNADQDLEIVEDAAQLMIELAMDSRHAPAVYGKSLLVLLAKVRDPSARHELGDGRGASQELMFSSYRRHMMVPDTQGVVTNNHSRLMQDQSWDLTSLFPDML